MVLIIILISKSYFTTYKIWRSVIQQVAESDELKHSLHYSTDGNYKEDKDDAIHKISMYHTNILKEICNFLFLK